MGDDHIEAVVAARRGVDEASCLRCRPVDAAVTLDGHQMAAGGIERDARALGRAGVAKMHADAGTQLVDVDRLGEIVDAAGFQRVHDVLGLGEAGHEDDGHLRQAGTRLDAPAGLETVHRRHDGVEKHEIGRDALDDIERGGSGCGDQHRETGMLQRVRQETQRLRASRRRGARYRGGRRSQPSGSTFSSSNCLRKFKKPPRSNTFR